MTRWRPAWRLWLLPSLAVLCGALALAAWHPGARGGVGAAIEGRLLDLRFAVRGPMPPPQGVAIIAFDDRAVARMDAFPPARADIATVVEQAFAAGARAVALDLLLVDTRPDDAALVAAMGLGPVVIGVAEAPAGEPPPALRDPAGFAIVTGPATSDPLPALGPAPGLQGHAALGHVTVGHAADGALRRMRPARPVATEVGPLVLPGLAVAAIAAGGPRPALIGTGPGRQGRLEGAWPAASLDLQGTLPLDFYGPAGAVSTLSAADLDGADLSGRVVFVGATATGFGDRHATTFDATLPGVEAHATLAANLLDGRTLRRDAVAWAGGGAVAVAAALAGLVAAGQRNPWAAAAAAGGLVLVVLAVLQAAFARGWWLDATTVLAALAVGLATGGAVRVLDTRRRAANLARYQSPRLVETLAAQADPLGHASTQPAVVVFVDAAGFTGHAERLGPDGTSAFLRAFHGLVEAAADPRGGTIIDFAGDGVLVVFGLPQPAVDDAERALAFLDALFAAAARDGIALRAGGHAGPVKVGLAGGARHKTVSVSGDVVNTASRLQEAAKAHGTALALSDALIAAAPRTWTEAAGLTRLADQRLRGRAATETIWIGEPAGSAQLEPAAAQGETA